MSKKEGIKIVLSGTSGTGKSTIAQLLENMYKEFDKDLFPLKTKTLFEQKITSTTRDIRLSDGEVDGVHYNFISREEFLELIKDNELIEYVEFPPNSPDSNFYGTPKNVLPTPNNPISTIILTPDGITDLEKTCKEKNIHLIHIHLDISDEEKLNRLVSRGDDQKTIDKRMNDGIRETFNELNRKESFLIDCSSSTRELTFIKVLETISSEIAKNLNEFDDNLKKVSSPVLKLNSKKIKQLKTNNRKTTKKSTKKSTNSTTKK